MVRLTPQPRPAVRAPRGVVATSHPVAAAVGRAVLRDGGSAVDAAVATAAALTVLEPTSNGLGGDAFAMVWDGDRLHGYNGSGRAPASLTGETLRAAGLERVPSTGWASVTVPGQVRAWADLHERFGRLPWDRLLEPAADLAVQGAAAPRVVAHFWERAVAAARQRHGPEFAAFLPTFAPDGHAPRPGERVSLLGHARTLRRLAEAGADDFYTGQVAQAVAAFSAQTDGFLSLADLARHEGEWVEPVTTAYGSLRLAEIPPNGQGIAALVALGTSTASISGRTSTTRRHCTSRSRRCGWPSPTPSPTSGTRPTSTCPSRGCSTPATSPSDEGSSVLAQGPPSRAGRRAVARC